MCNHSCVARKDSSIIWSASDELLLHAQFFACEIAKSSGIQSLVISIYLQMEVIT